MDLDINVILMKMTPRGARSSNSAGHVAHLMKLRTKVNMGQVLDMAHKSKTLRLEREFWWRCLRNWSICWIQEVVFVCAMLNLKQVWHWKRRPHGSRQKDSCRDGKKPVQQEELSWTWTCGDGHFITVRKLNPSRSTIFAIMSWERHCKRSELSVSMRATLGA